MPPTKQSNLAITQYCDRIIIFSLFLLIFITPLFFGLNVNSLDIQKISCLRVLSLIILCSWLIKVIWSRELNLVTAPLDWPILAFASISILSTIFSTNVWISLFGYYGHHEGLLVILNYMFIFYVVVNFINTRRLFLWLINVIVASGLSAAIYGWMQHLNLDPVKWELEFGRTPSSLGNPIAFGNYVAMTILLCLGLYLVCHEKKTPKPPLSKKKKRKGVASDQPQSLTWPNPVWIYASILGLSYIGFSYSNSRAPFLGLAAGLVLMSLLVGKRIWLERRRSLALAAGIFMILSLYFALTMEQSIFKRLLTTLAPQQEKIEQESSKAVTAGAALQEGRIYIWQGALKIIKDYPFLGTGIDTLGIIHPRYKPIESVMAEGAYATAASAHNEFLDIATSRGLSGIAAYFWLLIAFSLMVWQVYRSAQAEDKYIVSCLAATMLCYFIQNQFSPTGVSTSLFFWVVLALVCVQHSWLKPKIYNRRLLKHPDAGLQFGLSLAGLTGAILLFVLLVIRPCIADFNYEQGTLLQASKGQTDKDTLYRFERAVQFNPYETQYRRDVCAAYIELAKSLNPVVIKKAIDQAEALIRINAYDSIGYNVLGAAYYLQGKDLNKAIEAYKKSIEVDPYNPDSHNILALVYQKQGQLKKAAKEFREALHIKPDYDIVYNNLVNLYASSGKLDELENVLNGLISQDPGIRTIALRHKLSQFYLQRAKIEKAKEQYLIILRLDPKNEEGYERLFDIYYQQQQFKEAKVQLQRLLQISPTNTYASQMLERL